MQVEQPRIQVKHCKSRMRSIVHLETEQFKPSLKFQFALEKDGKSMLHGYWHLSKHLFPASKPNMRACYSLCRSLALHMLS